MTDWALALSRAFERHVEMGGSCGSCGSRERKPRQHKGLASVAAGTTSQPGVVPVVPTNNHVFRGTTGTTEPGGVVPNAAWPHHSPDQWVIDSGTHGTTGTTQNEADPASARDMLEERAALVEYGAGVPRDWAEAFALLHCSSVPSGSTPERWQQIIDDGGRFLDQWGNRAALLGWSAGDVFGSGSPGSASGCSSRNLVQLIGGGEVVSLDQTSATIRHLSGSLFLFVRRD